MRLALGYLMAVMMLFSSSACTSFGADQDAAGYMASLSAHQPVCHLPHTASPSSLQLAGAF